MKQTHKTSAFQILNYFYVVKAVLSRKLKVRTWFEKQEHLSVEELHRQIKCARTLVLDTVESLSEHQWDYRDSENKVSIREYMIRLIKSQQQTESVIGKLNAGLKPGAHNDLYIHRDMNRHYLLDMLKNGFYHLDSTVSGLRQGTLERRHSCPEHGSLNIKGWLIAHLYALHLLRCQLRSFASAPHFHAIVS